jgi:hypothetical protein
LNFKVQSAQDGLDAKAFDEFFDGDHMVLM